EIKIVNGKWQVLVNGVAYAKSASSGVEAIPTDIWYDLPAGLGVGTNVGVRPATSNNSSYGDNFRYGSLAQPIFVVSVDVVSDGDDGHVIRLEGKANANDFNNAEFAILTEAGEMLSDFTAVAGAPGAGTTFTIDCPISVLNEGIKN